jgi:Domain of unknown function (DUF4349)
MTSDQALMLQFQGGSTEAFDELFARYREPLFGFFRRRLNSCERAEDLPRKPSWRSDLLRLPLKLNTVRSQLFRSRMALKVTSNRNRNPKAAWQPPNWRTAVKKIEQMEAEKKNLANQVIFSTITATVREDYPAQSQVVPATTFGRLHNAAVQGYRDMVEGLVSTALFLLSYGPSLLLWGGLLFFPARGLWRRARRKFAQ